jgi:spoIIIJ-associated protein
LTTVEATGETVSEAKWKALRELERLEPSLDKAAVRFQVLEEGNRGLLGVGYSPARVVATAELAAAPEAAPIDESDAAAHLRDLLTHVTAAIGLRCRIDIDESDEAIAAVCSGGDLGLLIGRHGQTIDAVQTLANAIVRQDENARKQVVVDAAGYRDRRRRTVESLAVRSADEALRSGERVALEPMSSVERRLVHERLKDYDGVETESEGDEPSRYVVVFRAP